ncbi:MAG: class I SAM-dependent RNA methyltransferase [Anaerolineae bacterium]
MNETTFPLEIHDMAYTGYGVGRCDGKAIFVPYVVPGDQITAVVKQDKGRFAFARAASIVQPADGRIEPRCEHFGVCGGCQWQMAAYEAQIAYKQHIVADQLARIGGIRDAVVHPTIASPQPYQYRSHVTFNVDANGRLVFIQDDERTPLAIHICHIIRPELLEIFEELRDHNFGGAERVRLQVGSDPADRLVAITPLGRGARVELPLVNAAISLLDGDRSKAVRGSGAVTYTIKGKRYRVTAGSFFQVHLDQAARLVELVIAALGGTRIGHALDLYSGVGLFTAFLLDHAEQVTAVELYAPAVRDARANLPAEARVELITGAIEAVLPGLSETVDAAVIDPPRAGMDAKALDALIRLAPAKIVYVSCDPSTLARDAKRLIAGGWRLIDAQPVDMFPQTFHIETVAVFEKDLAQ